MQHCSPLHPVPRLPCFSPTQHERSKKLGKYAHDLQEDQSGHDVLMRFNYISSFQPGSFSGVMSWKYVERLWIKTKVTTKIHQNETIKHSKKWKSEGGKSPLLTSEGRMVIKANQQQTADVWIYFSPAAWNTLPVANKTTTGKKAAVHFWKRQQYGCACTEQNMKLLLQIKGSSSVQQYTSSRETAQQWLWLDTRRYARKLLKNHTASRSQ